MFTRNFYRPDILTAGLIINLSLIDVPTSTLLSLPREIRDDIFVHLLRAGDLAILRTSRQLYKECKERLYREGILRCKIGFRDNYPRAVLPPEWLKFQNLHLHIFVGRANIEGMPVTACMQLDELILLNETYPDVIYPKRECHIVFDFGTVDLAPGTHLNTCNMRIALPKLAPLVAFTTVVFSFVPGQSGLWEIEGTSKGKWEILNEYLERKLGPSKIICGADGEEERMVFRPLEFCNSKAQTEQTAEP